MSVYIDSSKTDQLREGSNIVVARSGISTCPVSAMEQYMELASIDITSEDRLFRGHQEWTEAA